MGSFCDTFVFFKKKLDADRYSLPLYGQARAGHLKKTIILLCSEK